MRSEHMRAMAMLIAGASLFGLAACAQPSTPEDRAVGMVELWLAAFDAGDEDQAQWYACDGVQLGGVNSDVAGTDGYEIEAIRAFDDGRYGIDVAVHYAEQADLRFSFRVDTQDDLCIAGIH